MAELVLHTLPAESDFYTYEPVAGITALGRETVWDKQVMSADEMPKTVAQTFEVPALFAQLVATSLSDFNSSRWIASIPIAGHPSSGLPISNINCHAFASMVADKKPTWDGKQAERQARKIVTNGMVTEPPLQAGQQGVIARFDETKRWKSRAAKPFHSIIGLGPEYASCLQVTNLAGWVALSSYEDVLNGFSVGYPGSNNRLYVRES